MIKLKASELSGAQLDYYSSIALGYQNMIIIDDDCFQIKKTIINSRAGEEESIKRVRCSPTNCAETFLSVFKSTQACLEAIGRGWWGASCLNESKRFGDPFLSVYGQSPEEALFRLFVTLKLGEFVEGVKTVH